MKILYIITKSNWGGAQRHVYDLATEMKALGHDVKAAVGGAGVLKDALEKAGIFTYSIASMGRDISLGGDAGSLKEIYSVIKDQQPDTIHLHSPKASGLGALAGRLLGVKNIIMTVHGWTWNESRPLPEKILIVLASWITALLCHKAIVISDHDYKQGLRLPGLAKRMVQIPVAVKTSPLFSIEGSKQFLAKAMNMDVAEFSRKTVVGTIAELHPNKGLSYLIEAMVTIVAKYPNVVCPIISSGQEKSRLENLIRLNGLEKNVFLLGFVENAAQYLKAFSIFVLPSIKEGLPSVILEAGSASLPVVATSVGGTPEIIADMHSGILVPPRKSRDLAHAIMFVIEHPKERREYGANLKQTITEKYSFQKMISEIGRIYTNLTVQ